MDQLPSYSSGNWASAATTGIESALGIEYFDDLVPRMHRMDMHRRANERRHLNHPITEYRVGRSSQQSAMPAFDRRWYIPLPFPQLRRKQGGEGGGGGR